MTLRGIINSIGEKALPWYVFCSYVLLYIPIIVLVIFSFNDSAFPFEWRGFTWRWYFELWESTEVWDAVLDSCVVAFSSVALSVMMGTLVVIYGEKAGLRRYFFLFYGSVAAPEIVLAVGLLSVFIFMSVPLGFVTLIISHTLIGLGYVIPIMQARFAEIDKRLLEASLDLGATHGQTMQKVIIPFLFPALFSSALLVFIISWDDFLLSFFCSGSSVQTLPMYIFSMIRSGATPVVNALSTVLLLFTSIFVLTFSYFKVGRGGSL